MNLVRARGHVWNREFPISSAYHEVSVIENSNVAPLGALVNAGGGVNWDFGNLEGVKDRGRAGRHGHCHRAISFRAESKIMWPTIVVPHAKLLTGTQGDESQSRTFGLENEFCFVRGFFRLQPLFKRTFQPNERTTVGRRFGLSRAVRHDHRSLDRDRLRVIAPDENARPSYNEEGNEAETSEDASAKKRRTRTGRLGWNSDLTSPLRPKAGEAPPGFRLLLRTSPRRVIFGKVWGRVNYDFLRSTEREQLAARAGARGRTGGAGYLEATR